MSLYWLDPPCPGDETPTYNPTILFDAGLSNVYLKNPCVMCGEKMKVYDVRRVVEEMIENGWSHPGAGTIVCNKLECRSRFKQ